MLAAMTCSIYVSGQLLFGVLMHAILVPCYIYIIKCLMYKGCLCLAVQHMLQELEQDDIFLKLAIIKEKMLDVNFTVGR
jgi:hypothetical protein